MAVSPPDHNDFLVAEEGAIAGRTSADAIAHQLAFIVEPKQPSGGASCDDQRIAGQLTAIIHIQHFSLFGEIHRTYGSKVIFGAESLRLLPKSIHQLWAHDSFGEAWVDRRPS